MSAIADAPLVRAHDRATWRAWLEANHAFARGCLARAARVSEAATKVADNIRAR